jgi:rod shape-determining protein MreC
MPARGVPRSTRNRLILWFICAGLSGLMLATPPGFRGSVASALEWSIFLPVRAVLGWGGRSLFVSTQNRKLQKELTAERLETARLSEAGRENQTLRRMLGMQARADLSLIPGRVVARSTEWPGEILWLEVTGRPAMGLAVVTPDGLIGRVARAVGSRALVETLWHSRVAVSVVDARSREQGILRWDPARPGEVSIEQVPLQADYRAGDAVITSGMGEVFPKGILVGHVLAGEEDEKSQLKRIRVRPAVRRGRALEVFLVEERPPAGDATKSYPEPEGRPAGVPPLPGGATGSP